MGGRKKPHGRPGGFRKRGPAPSAQRLAAEEAGMSRHQMRQALAVAEIPEEEVVSLEGLDVGLRVGVQGNSLP